jgi:septal ring factor EnvC (AmiA/AmiB activator)
MTMEDNAQLIVEVKQMTAEMLTTTRSLAPTLAALDGRLDQVEKAHIRTEAAIAALHEKLGKLDEQEHRVKSLEDDRIRVKAWAALIAFMGSIAAFLVGHFWPK